MGAELIIGAIGLVIAAGGAAASYESSRKAESQAKDRAAEDLRLRAEDLRLRQELANQSMAPVVKNEGDVQLQSEESLSDEEILARSKKNRLRVGKTEGLSPTTAPIGTGLKVG